jgi:hypothetical protein
MARLRVIVNDDTSIRYIRQAFYSKMFWGKYAPLGAPKASA